jgi:basic membrane protein A and related proteins
MRKQRRYGVTATLISAMLILVACQGNTSPGASGQAVASGNTIDVGKGLCRQVGDSTATPATPPAASGTSDAKIGVVTDVGALDDKNFNEYSWIGTQWGATAIGAPAPQNIITTDSSEYEANIQSFVDDGYDLIVTVGFALGAATLAAAGENPDTHFLGVDQFQTNSDNFDPEVAPLPNYESVIFQEAQAGYLAGIVAASISKSGEIAAIGGSGTIPPVINYARGFENGAKSVKSDIKVHIKYISNDLTAAFNDPAGGKTFGDQFLAQNTNVDVLFQVAGKTGNGLLQAVEEAGIYGIGVDVDQWQSLPDQAECIVTSAEKKLSKAVSEGIIAFGAGQPRSSNVFYGADNDGIGLSPFYQFADLITTEVQGKIDDAFSGMGSGDLDPCQPSGLCYAGVEDMGT